MLLLQLSKMEMMLELELELLLLLLCQGRVDPGRAVGAVGLQGVRGAVFLGQLVQELGESPLFMIREQGREVHWG
ncbi:hypothetical protein BC939DRAFT_458171 [Gamsiella multidivaricata]|uniref:uncharacterized protein n=1 Tax=Gamsiella multidivaricata TaxID=101098 RepID=UPI0022211001|nr:uncharacterized protein BC939DRAFT_458171 [Gamsiella multidivaricata]KAI7820262.1 hypothetical protein BC939DRAFT_458171 [Gamsiella multidivaricata]